MHKDYLLGLDGGGTKTDVLVCCRDGQVVSRFVGGPSSLTGQDRETAFAHIRESLEGALAPVGGRSAPIAGFYAGISGGGLEANRQAFQGLFRELLSGLDRWDCGTDAVNALSAGIEQENGSIAIAGTGSSVFGRKGGALRQVGGWGYLLGDEGSGFDLGRRALMAALRATDGRGRATALAKLCPEKLGCSLRQALPEFYGPEGKTRIAAFAPLLLQAAQAGDSVAVEELGVAAGDMALAIRCAGEWCASPRVVLGGSVWKNPLYRGAVEAALGSEYQLIQPELPPVYGSVVLAAGLAGIPWTEDCRRRVGETLPSAR